MSKDNLPHDAFFKTYMSDIETAKDFIRAHLPKDILALLDLEDLTLCQETYIDAKLAKSLTDVVYRTTYNQEEAYLFVLVEHISSPKATSLLQIMRYALSVAEHHMHEHKTNHAPAVIPLAIYNGQTPWKLPLNWLDLFGKGRELMNRLYNEALPFIDLTQITDDEIREHARVALMEWCLKHAREKNVMAYVKTLAELFIQSGILEDEKKLLQTVHYLLYNMDGEEAFIVALVQHFPKEAQENIMTIAERIENRGLEKGIQQGVDNTILAVELIEKNLSLEDVEKRTGIDIAHLKVLLAKLKH